MKKFLFTIISIFWLSYSIQAQEHYVITGKLGKEVVGELFLMAHTATGILQLNETQIKENQFEFSGSITEPTVTYIMTAQRQLIAILILENSTYTLTSGEFGFHVEGGGKEQEIWNHFETVNEKIAKGKMQADKEMYSAYSQNNQTKAIMIKKNFEKLMQDCTKEEEELIKTYPNSLVSAYVVATKAQQIPIEQLDEWYELLGETAKTSFFGKITHEMLERFQQVNIGAIAPDFNAALPEKGSLQLHSTKGKLKLIDFWASWCAPCRSENKNLEKLYKKYHKEGLEIISVSLDEQEEKWKQAIQTDNMTWKNVSDLKGWNSAIAKLYFVKAIPHTLLLDEDNRIIAKNLRGHELQKKIAEILEKKK